jgi:hypothetical protein
MRSGKFDAKIITALALVLPVAGAILLTFNDASAQVTNTKQSPGGMPAKIADVAWIAGHWESKRPAALLQEHWSEPAGDGMMGMFRWLKKDKTWIYEILAIREEGGSLVFRFRHFSDKMHAWEEKEKPLMFRLVSLTKREAVFENPSGDDPGRYIFSRPDDKTLLVKVGSKKAGTVEFNEFRYQLK